jgi:hypothetical protein
MRSDYYHDDPVDVEHPKKKKISKSPKSFALLFCAGAFLLQTTFASNINLGTNSAVEFGQGVTRTVACSGSTALTLNPISSFSNSSGAGAYYLSGFSVSNIPSSCNGADLINAYGSSDATPLSIFNSTSKNAVVWSNNGTFQLGVGGSGASVSSGSGSFTISFASPVSLASAVYRVTIQSGPHTIPPLCSEGGDCAIGDTGPGGGTVFYVSASGFTATGSACNTNCHYLEFAPKGWASLADWPNNIGEGGRFMSARSSVNEDPYLVWSDGAFASLNPGSIAVGQNIGTGYQNTQQILSNTVTSGKSPRFSFVAALNYAGAAGSSTTGQWFLPSIKELNELCKYARGQIGALGDTSVQCTQSGTTINSSLGFDAENNIYLSSSYGAATNGNGWIAGYRIVYPANPALGDYYANWGGKVRPIRVF